MFGLEAILLSTLVSGALSIGAAAMSKPKIPKAPVQTTGLEPELQAAQTLEEDNVQKQSSRQVARKGAAAYRIPLQAKSTGVATGSGSGLNI